MKEHYTKLYPRTKKDPKVDKNAEFNKTIQVTKFVLLICGVNLDGLGHKEFKKKTLFFALYCFNTLWLQSIILAELAWCYFEGIIAKDFSVLTYLAPCIMYGFLGNVKSFFIIYHENTTRQLIDGLMDLFPSRNSNKTQTKFLNKTEEDKILSESTNISKNVVFILFSVNVLLITCFILKPIYEFAYKLIWYGDIVLTLPLTIYYPFDPINDKVWIFAYIYQFWAGTISILMLIGGDTFFFVCCTQLQMHFKITSSRFAGFIEEYDGKANETELRDRMRVLIKRHQKLIELVALLEKMYSTSNFLNYLTSSFLICLTGFNVTILNDVWSAAVFLVFLSANVSQIFLVCLFGDMIMRSSLDVSDGLYKCKWYLASPRSRKDLLWILARSQKPCRLTAIRYADVNLTTFTTILSRSYSYFALLNTMSISQQEDRNSD